MPRCAIGRPGGMQHEKSSWVLRHGRTISNVPARHSCSSRFAPCCVEMAVRSCWGGGSDRRARNFDRSERMGTAHGDPTSQGCPTLCRGSPGGPGSIVVAKRGERAQQFKMPARRRRWSTNHEHQELFDKKGRLGRWPTHLAIPEPSALPSAVTDVGANGIDQYRGRGEARSFPFVNRRHDLDTPAWQPLE